MARLTLTIISFRLRLSPSASADRFLVRRAPSASLVSKGKPTWGKEWSAGDELSHLAVLHAFIATVTPRQAGPLPDERTKTTRLTLTSSPHARLRSTVHRFYRTSVPLNKVYLYREICLSYIFDERVLWSNGKNTKTRPSRTNSKHMKLINDCAKGRWLTRSYYLLIKCKRWT